MGLKEAFANISNPGRAGSPQNPLPIEYQPGSHDVPFADNSAFNTESESDDLAGQLRLAAVVATKTIPGKLDAIAGLLRMLVPSSNSDVFQTRVEDAGSYPVGTFAFNVVMRQDKAVRYVWVENNTAAIVNVYAGEATTGVPILTINPGTYRGTPPPSDNLKTVTVVAIGTGGGASKIIRVVMGSSFSGPSIGSIV